VKRSPSASTALPRFVLFAAQATALLGMAWWPAGRSTPWPALWLWGIAFAAYLGSWRSADLVPRRAIWAGGVLLRAGLLPLTPFLSDDIYRYVWDGWVARNGINPFLYAPADSQLETIRTGWWSLINHPEIPTIYPPGAQIAFTILALLTAAWPLFKLAWILADLGVAWLIDRLARKRFGPGRHGPLLLYLWSPLLVVEVAWSGHLETLGLLPMVAALAFLAGRQRDGDEVDGRAAEAGDRPGEAEATRGAWAGGALLGLGAAVKFAPLAAWPALWRRHGSKPAAIALLVPALLYLPYAAAGPRLFEALGTYAERWEFNPGLFQLLVQSVGAGTTPRWLAGGVVLLVAVGGAWKRWSVERTLFWTIGAALLLSPTLHPWYVLWILPFACLLESGPWITLTGTVFLGYAGRDAFHATGVWPQPTWLALLVHAPVVVWLVAQAASGYLARSSQVPGGEQARERDRCDESRGHQARHRPDE
jgi:hypothetical protein